MGRSSHFSLALHGRRLLAHVSGTAARGRRSAGSDEHDLRAARLQPYPAVATASPASRRQRGASGQASCWRVITHKPRLPNRSTFVQSRAGASAGGQSGCPVWTAAVSRPGRRCGRRATYCARRWVPSCGPRTGTRCGTGSSWWRTSPGLQGKHSHRVRAATRRRSTAHQPDHATSTRTTSWRART